MAHFDTTVIVPTAGKRLDLLQQCLKSFFPEKGIQLIVVCPEDASIAIGSHIVSDHRMVHDPTSGGLAGAINKAVKMVETEFFTWIGDDDLLDLEGLGKSVEMLRRNPDSVASFGKVTYINAQGSVIGQSSLGKPALRLATWGPNLIPQPGSIVRTKSFKEIGELDESFSLAFDHDMFLRLRKIGRIEFIESSVASFRWHGNSLSAGNRISSANESHRTRLKNSNLGFVIFIPSLMSTVATIFAGWFLNWANSMKR